MKSESNHQTSLRVLKINIGFLLTDSPGSFTNVTFEIPNIRFDESLAAENIAGELILSRTRRGIFVSGELRVERFIDCARCLKNFLYPVTFELEELFVYPPTPEAEFSVSEAGILDLAPLIREEIILNTPTNAVCRPDCKGLCPTCGQDLNEGECECEEDDIDPRMEVLRTLLEE